MASDLSRAYRAPFRALEPLRDLETREGVGGLLTLFTRIRSTRHRIGGIGAFDRAYGGGSAAGARAALCTPMSNFFVSTPLDTRRRESVAASPDGYPSVLFGSGEETGGDRWMENLIETMARSLRGFYRRGNALSGSSAAGMLVFLFVAQPGGW